MRARPVLANERRVNTLLAYHRARRRRWQRVRRDIELRSEREERQHRQTVH